MAIIIRDISNEFSINKQELNIIYVNAFIHISVCETENVAQETGKIRH